MKEKENKKSFKSEFGMMLALLKIGFIGFGGGSALIPVIEKEVVEERGLVTEEEFNKDVLVASITPGALPMEISTGLGKRAYGVGGMIASALMLAFPGALITVAMLVAMSRLHSGILTQIEILSIGISAFIACLLTEYSRKTLAEARAESKGRWKRAVVILAGVFLASRESLVVRTVLQEALWSGRTHTYRGAGFLLIIVPAVYSIFLLRFFEKGGKNAAWKEKVKMMGAVSINTVMALLGLLCFNYMLDGHSMEECRIVLEESFASIGWESGLLSIALMYFVFYIIKRDHFKHKIRRRKPYAGNG